MQIITPEFISCGLFAYKSLSDTPDLIVLSVFEMGKYKIEFSFLILTKGSPRCLQDLTTWGGLWGGTSIPLM